MNLVENEKTIKSEKIYEGKVISVKIDTVELPDKKYCKREIVEHPGAVAVILINENNNLVLIKQYRKAIEDYLLEIPAGKIELKESPYDTALRELKEETGYTASSLTKLLSFYTSPGFANEIIHVFVAKDVTKGEATPDIGEFVEMLEFPMDTILEMIKEGKIKDAKTVTAILAYLQFYEK